MQIPYFCRTNFEKMEIIRKLVKNKCAELYFWLFVNADKNGVVEFFATEYCKENNLSIANFRKKIDCLVGLKLIERLKSTEKNTKIKIPHYSNENSALFDSLNNDMQSVVLSWFEYKKQRKQMYKTEKSKNQFIKRLIELSNNDVKLAKSIVNRSISNNWKGIFALPTKNITVKQDLQNLQKMNYGDYLI